MILSRRPHRLSYLSQGLGKVLPNGDYQPAPPMWVGAIPCNGVPSGKATEHVFDDGVARLYSYTIYLDTTARDFKLGEKLRLEALGKVVELEVKGFARYQTYCKIWA